MIKNILLILVGLFILFVLTDFGEEKTEKRFPIIYTSTAEEELIPGRVGKNLASLEVLRRECPQLFIYGGDNVKEAKAFSHEAYDYQKEKYGWEKTTEVEVILKDKVKKMPPTASRSHLFFYIGSGEKSGIVADKIITQQICGWEVSENGAATFREIPELK